jgi:hypothetical protein
MWIFLRYLIHLVHRIGKNSVQSPCRQKPVYLIRGDNNPLSGLLILPTYGILKPAQGALRVKILGVFQKYPRYGVERWVLS